MNSRADALVFALLGLLLSVDSTAQGLPSDAVAVVADPVTLAREVDGSAGVFEVQCLQDPNRD